MVHPIEDSKELNMHVRSVIIVTIESKEPKSLRVPHYTSITQWPWVTQRTSINIQQGERRNRCRLYDVTWVSCGGRSLEVSHELTLTCDLVHSKRDGRVRERKRKYRKKVKEKEEKEEKRRNKRRKGRGTRRFEDLVPKAISVFPKVSMWMPCGSRFKHKAVCQE
ncbi:hypothetical protein JHK82_048054 [Glycine max]|nr:hypothetical protein JHK86_047932 [Glycine max]KAG5098200.1 hypothetical protein JHK82_048054 [Glycine max]KAG5102991.1 hypothetical protein JHK84_047960 [Glycine max]